MLAKQYIILNFYIDSELGEQLQSDPKLNKYRETSGDSVKLEPTDSSYQNMQIQLVQAATNNFIK